MENLIDVHAHLDFPHFKEDLDKTIKRAEKEGVKLIVNSGVNPKANRKALELSKKYPLIKPSFGLYPTDSIAKSIQDLVNASEESRHLEPFNVEEELKWIEENKEECIAIGEIGLDDKVFPNTLHLQIPVFKKALHMAKKINKPVIIHSRKAELKAIEILEECGIKKVNMHCFMAKKSLIKRVINNGWFMSIPPVIARLQHFQMLAEISPIENLLTETDAPFLSPIPGKRNEPSFVSETIKVIAKIKEMPPEEVSKKIWENAKRFFEIKDEKN